MQTLFFWAKSGLRWGKQKSCVNVSGGRGRRGAVGCRGRRVARRRVVAQAHTCSFPTPTAAAPGGKHMRRPRPRESRDGHIPPAWHYRAARRPETPASPRRHPTAVSLRGPRGCGGSLPGCAAWHPGTPLPSLPGDPIGDAIPYRQGTPVVPPCMLPVPLWSHSCPSPESRISRGPLSVPLCMLPVPLWTPIAVPPRSSWGHPEASPTKDPPLFPGDPISVPHP